MIRGLLLGLTIGAVLFTLQARPCQPRTAKVPPDVFKAVRAYWKTPSERRKAFDVIAGETGNAFNTNAVNGQYLGIFQMGASERRLFGHGTTAMAQARAARRYYDYKVRIGAWGWSPWSCA